MGIKIVWNQYVFILLQLFPPIPQLKFYEEYNTEEINLTVFN